MPPAGLTGNGCQSRAPELQERPGVASVMGLPLLTIATVAKQLAVHRSTLYLWAEQGLFPVVRLPSVTLRVDPNDLAA